MHNNEGTCPFSGLVDLPSRLLGVSLTDQALLEVVPLLLSEIFLLAGELAGHHQQRPDVVFLVDSLFHPENLSVTFLRIHWLTADAVLRTLVDFHLPARVFFFTLHSHFNPIVDSQHTSPHHGLKVKRFAKAAFGFISQTGKGHKVQNWWTLYDLQSDRTT